MTKIVVVGERDIVHERHDPEFRLFVYEGPSNAVTVYRISECSVEQALEAAEMLSRKDELLWSLALAVRSPDPSLIWISWMDYNKKPECSREWRLRAHMQSRYFLAKSRVGEPQPRLPSGLRRIRMFPEWTVDLPLWGISPDPYPYEPGMLALPEDLERELIEWSREWGSYDLDTPDRPDSWKDRGWSLRERVQDALRDIAEVIPQFDDRQD